MKLRKSYKEKKTYTRTGKKKTFFWDNTVSASKTDWVHQQKLVLRAMSWGFEELLPALK